MVNFSGAIQMKFEPECKSHNFEKSLRNARKLVNSVQILSKWTERRTPKKIFEPKRRSGAFRLNSTTGKFQVLI